MHLPKYKIIEKVLDVPLQNIQYPGFMLGAYHTIIGHSSAEHAILYKPRIGELGEAPLVRINSACFTGDIFGDRRCDCTEQLFAAMDQIAANPGLIIYHFHHEGRGLGFTGKLSTYKQMEEEEISTFEAMKNKVDVQDLRRYGSAILILKDLGLTKIRLITNNPEKRGVLENNGIEVVETVPVIIDRPEIRRYLATKQAEQGHAIHFNDRATPSDCIPGSKKEGLIILGAKGSLGSAFTEAATNNGKFEGANIHLFDKTLDASFSVKSCDLSSTSSINAALSEIDFSQSDHWRILVATGIYNGTDPSCTNWEEISNTLQVNLIGACQFVIGAVDKIKKSEKTARIVVVSSAAAGVGSRDLGYGISKAGLTGLVRSISKQSAKDGITAIGIAPGLFKSAMSRDHQSDDRKKDAIHQTHLGRSLELNEIVKTAFFAMYEAPDALTGTFINPNGGQVISVEPGF